MANLKLIQVEALGQHLQANWRALEVGLENARIGRVTTIPVWVEERPAIIVVDEDDETKVYGVMQWNPKIENPFEMYVNWTHSDHPRAFLMMAARMRTIARETGAKSLTFAVYAANQSMRDIAERLGAHQTMISYEVEI